jgi:hypothetical protein
MKRIMMRRTAVVLATVVLLAVRTGVYGMYSVADKGMWPESWPRELEGLRKQARTMVGPMVDNRHYQIPFTKREEFEAAWPHILKIKSKGAPIILVRGAKTDFMKVEPAGVLIHTPPIRRDGRGDPEEPLPGKWPNVRGQWTKTSLIELVVDGEIVDLNRIELPGDTPIIDERFSPPRMEEKKAPEVSGVKAPEGSGTAPGAAPPASLAR